MSLLLSRHYPDRALWRHPILLQARLLLNHRTTSLLHVGRLHRRGTILLADHRSNHTVHLGLVVHLWLVIAGMLLWVVAALLVRLTLLLVGVVLVVAHELLMLLLLLLLKHGLQVVVYLLGVGLHGLRLACVHLIRLLNGTNLLPIMHQLLWLPLTVRMLTDGSGWLSWMLLDRLMATHWHSSLLQCIRYHLR